MPVEIRLDKIRFKTLSHRHLYQRFVLASKRVTNMATMGDDSYLELRLPDLKVGHEGACIQHKFLLPPGTYEIIGER